MLLWEFLNPSQGGVFCVMWVLDWREEGGLQVELTRETKASLETVGKGGSESHGVSSWVQSAPSLGPHMALPLHEPVS